MASFLLLLSLFLPSLPPQRQLILVAGQSNCTGHGDKTQSVAAGPAAFEYRGSTGTLVPLKDPVGEQVDHFEAAASGSAWPAFAQAWHAQTGDTVIIVPTSRGGSSCHEKARLGAMDTWDNSGTLFAAAVAKTKAAMRATGLPLKCIIWVQGERDANAINDGHLTTAEYKAALQQVVHRFREALGAQLPFYIVKTGYYANHSQAGFHEVQRIQSEVANADPYTKIVFEDAGTFLDKKWMTDEIHYNQTGLNTLGAAVARNILQLTATPQNATHGKAK
ncbi:protein of unknown function [Chitinophaga costaii]|uniref:Sialate O-acetylesterase domain-containing protein n=1 Tax=Chitinophaga costaii TaxID=1335309 RepID=A0A1C4D2S6_9BACT|nr:sialate O-acetylesterase [Chitinophaga costaii]PUZ24440.1 hypothetical protein DCM91_11010 [Chitinophaga costaii]SCC25744.1 protein of unknown function [Chitinophaga costaii]